MSDFVLFSDSNTDLPVDLAANMEIIPFSFRVDEKDYLNYLDNRELDPHVFYDMLREGKTSSTTLITSFTYTEAFEPFVKEGKDILYLCFSSGLSGSYTQALIAAEELMERYSGRKVIVIDTLCASMGQGLLAYHTLKEKERGKSLEEVAAFVKETIPHLCHWVAADDLAHLRRGGRVSGASAFVGTILGIKPIIHVNDEGKLIPVDKVRGRTKSLEYLADKLVKTIDPKEQIIFISHGDVIDSAKDLAAIIENRTGNKTFITNYIGPVIGSHSGPGTVALFFLGTHR